MNAQHKEKGFTIIEVVLVLAIAGLIFLMVFIALPALQRSQRDSQRDQDLSRAQTALNSFQQKNRNTLPTGNWNTQLRDAYLITGGTTSGGNDDFTDPSGKPYTFTALASATAPTNKDMLDSSQANVRVYYTTGATCDTGGNVLTGQGNRKVAFRLVLEGGGIACRSN